MAEKYNSPTPSSGGFQLPPWLVIVLILVAAGFSWLRSSPTEIKQPKHTTNDSAKDSSPEVVKHNHTHRSTDSHSEAQTSEESSFTIKDQTIRDLDGKIVYQGTIDLKPTLDRIERGESNRHRNDGTVFQNREGRLPRKPHNYYKEYVNPTPGEHGPGPQRIIIGQDGDIWYTPDHYQTFLEIKKP